MGFGDLTTDAGLAALNDFLLNHSYIEGCVIFFFLLCIWSLPASIRA
jgi:hypothetical protein